ncbi:hypothetical protein ABLO26_24320 [Neobacillus sp. 179-J 1A1 HS]|uniref:hypothetical protein n=1 Tax=Neobacillus driksii TaxID=3035913 RepID=UPI0035BBD962
MEHIEKVREAKKTRNHLSSIQESQIANLVHKKCIERNYDRENYLNMTGSELFFIVYDFNDVSLVVIPEDRAPLLISEQDILMLNSLEMVTNPFRMLFLKEFLNVDKMTFKQYYLVRLDVVSSIEDLTSSDLAYYGYEEFSNYREWIKGLILFSKA